MVDECLSASSAQRKSVGCRYVCCVCMQMLTQRNIRITSEVMASEKQIQIQWQPCRIFIYYYLDCWILKKGKKQFRNVCTVFEKVMAWNDFPLNKIPLIPE